MTTATEALIDECQRQSENCAYTATNFIIWLRFLRTFRLSCHVLPLVFGALATWKILAQSSPIWAAVFTLLATVIPPVYRASRTDASIDDYTLAAGEFTNLRDRFRHAALVHSKKPFPEFEAETNPLFDRLEKARKRPLTPPEWCFRFARRKHQAGHYSHDYDAAKRADKP